MKVDQVRVHYPKVFEEQYREWASRGGDALLDDWWDYIFDDAKAEGLKHGFRIDDIRFSGFWSQGDGASWSGIVHIPTFIDASGDTDPRWQVMKVLMDEGWVDATLGIVPRGSYSYVHEQTMGTVGLEVHIGYYDDGVIQNSAYAGANVETLYDAIGNGGTVNELGQWVLDKAREFAQDIYISLRNEYERLSSEEQYIEYCNATDVEFDVMLDVELS